MNPQELRAKAAQLRLAGKLTQAALLEKQAAKLEQAASFADVESGSSTTARARELPKSARALPVAASDASAAPAPRRVNQTPTIRGVGDPERERTSSLEARGQETFEAMREGRRPRLSVVPLTHQEEAEAQERQKAFERDRIMAPAAADATATPKWKDPREQTIKPITSKQPKINPDLMAGQARQLEEMATYAEQQGKVAEAQRLRSLSSRLLRDAGIAHSLGGPLAEGASTFLRSASFGIVDPQRTARLARERTLARGDQVTPEELAESLDPSTGALSAELGGQEAYGRDPSKPMPRALGDEGQETARMAANLAGGIAGLRNPLALERAAGAAAARGIGKGLYKAGVAPISAAERMAGAVTRAPKTFGGRVLREAAEYGPAGAVTEGVNASLEGRDRGEVVDIMGRSLATNAVMGGAFGAGVGALKGAAPLVEKVAQAPAKARTALEAFRALRQEGPGVTAPQADARARARSKIDETRQLADRRPLGPNAWGEGEAQKTREVAARAKESLAGGGYTLHPETGAPQEAGFAVGFGGARPVKRAELTDDLIAQKIEEQRLLHRRNPRVRAGGWVDGDDVYLEPSEVFPKKEDAIKAARARGEKAIFDLSKFEEIRVEDEPVVEEGGYDTIAGEEPAVALREGRVGSKKVFRFDHYSQQEGLQQIDPRFMGTGRPGAERARPGRAKAVHVYEAGARPEKQFEGDRRYSGEVPADQVYDLERDPDKIISRLSKNGTRAIDLDHLEREIAKKYLGYRRGTIAKFFQPVPVAEASARGNRRGVGGVTGARRGGALGTPKIERTPGMNANDRFYSRVDDAIRSAPFEKGTRAQWIAHLEKNSPAFEREWVLPKNLHNVERPGDTGMEDVLTRQEVLRMQSPIVLKETVRGETPEKKDYAAQRARLTVAYDNAERAKIRAQAELGAAVRRAQEGNVTAARPRPMDYVPYMREIIRNRDVIASGFPRPGQVATPEERNRFAFLWETPEIAEAERRLSEAEKVAQDANEARYRLERVKPEAAEARYEDYSQPGGDNYREILIQLPTMDRVRRRGEESVFESSHWDEPNVLAHVLVKDRKGPNGEKVLFVEEVQSDWHQQGREVGYEGTPDQKAAKQREYELERAYDRALEESDRARSIMTGTSLNDPAYETASSRVFEADETVDQTRTALLAFRRENHANLPASGSGVPDAPFKKTDEWLGLAMKRVIDEAVAGGYDRISWATGQQLVDKYSLEKKVDSIHYDPHREALVAYRDGEFVLNEIVGKDKLASYIGRELADRLLASPRTPPSRYFDGKWHVLEGDDLKVGGKGMKVFYDEIVPKVVKDYAKKLGIKIDVEGADVGLGTGEPRTGTAALLTPKGGINQSFKVPEQLAERVRRFGQPLGALGALKKRQLQRLTSEVAGILAGKYRGRKVEPGYATEIEAAVRRGLPDVLDAVEKSAHAEDWYKAAIGRMESHLREMIPSVEDPTNMRLFKAMLAITSNGLKPYQNIKAAISLYRRFEATGFDMSKLSLLKDPASPRIRTEKGGMKFDSKLDEGQVGGTMLNAWEYTLRQFRDHLGPDRSTWDDKLIRLYAERVNLPHRRGDTGETIEVDSPSAVPMFGPKIGRFYANLNGSARDVTVDKWAHRTLARWMGTVPTFTKNAESGFEDQAAVSDAEANVMRVAVAKLAEVVSKKTGKHYDPMDIQALLWYYEKQRYLDLGARDSEQIGYDDAAARVREEEGQLGLGAGLGEGPPRPNAGGRKASPRKRAARAGFAGAAVEPTREGLEAASDKLFADAELERQRYAEQTGSDPDDYDDGLGICTTCADNIVRQFGGKVVGYSFRQNPDAKVGNPGAKGDTDDGHDFAIVAGRYLVDPWAKHVSGESPRASFDLQDPKDRAKIRDLYGDSSKWVQRTEDKKDWEPYAGPKRGGFAGQAVEAAQSALSKLPRAEGRTVQQMFSLMLGPGAGALAGPLVIDNDELSIEEKIAIGALVGAAGGVAFARAIDNGLRRGGFEPNRRTGALGPQKRVREGVGTVRTDRPIDDGKDPRLVNMAKFELDAVGEKELRSEIASMPEKDRAKKTVTWQETRAVAEELGLDEDAIVKQDRRLTGAELLAIRNLVSRNVARIETLSKDAMNPTIAADKRTELLDEVARISTRNQQFLARFIKERSAVGRDLNALKIVAKNTMAPAVWILQGQRMKGVLALSQEEIDTITRLARERDRTGLVRFVSGLQKSSPLDKALTLWKAGLLSALPTHAANFTGNLSMGILETAKEPIAYALDSLITIARGEPHRSKDLSLGGLVFGTARGIGQGFREAKAIFKTGVRPEDLEKWDVSRVNFDSAYFRAYTDLVFNSLEATDRVFRGAALGRSLTENLRLHLRRQGVAPGTPDFGRQLDAMLSGKAPIPDEVMVRSIADAEFATFRNDNVVSTLISSGSKAVKKRFPKGAPLARAALTTTVPFVKTPTNVAARLVDYTPLGVITTLARQISDPDQKKLVEGMARAGLGSSLVLAGWTLGSEGKASGAMPTDAGERAEWELEGRIPNAVKIGDEWVEVGRIAPLGMLLTLGAQLQRMAADANDKQAAVTGSVGAVGRLVTDQSFLRGVSSLIEAMQDPDRKGSAFVNSYARSAPGFVGFPTALMGRVASALDDRERVADTPAQAFKSGLPGLREQNPERVDAFGAPVRSTQSAIGKLASPMRTSTDRSTPLLDEMRRLGVTPSLPGGKVEDATTRTGNRTRTPAEKRSWFKDVGPEQRAALEAMVARPEYQAIGDDLKQALFDAVQSRVSGEGYTRERGQGTERSDPKLVVQEAIESLAVRKLAEKERAAVDALIAAFKSGQRPAVNGAQGQAVLSRVRADAREALDRAIVGGDQAAILDALRKAQAAGVNIETALKERIRRRLAVQEMVRSSGAIVAPPPQ